MIISGVTLTGVTVVDQAPGLSGSQQLLINSDFNDGSTGWSATGGFGTYSYTSSNQVAVLDGVLYFTYVDRTVSQSVAVSDVISLADQFVAVCNIRHREKSDAGTYTSIDTYTFTLTFFNAANSVVATKTTGRVNAPQYFTDIELALARSEIPAIFDTITSVLVSVSGIDTGFWNGNHGPMVDRVTLTVS